MNAQMLAARRGLRGGRRAGHQYRFAQRDDDEQRAAFGHVRAVDAPVRGVERPSPGT